MAEHADTTDRELTTTSAIDELDGDDTDETFNPSGEIHTARGSLGIGAAIALGCVAVAVIAGLTGWLGYSAYQDHQVRGERNLYMSAARQAALNLTTLDFTEVETDVARILDSATGPFRDDFQKRSQPLIDVVKQVQSKSQGTVTEAGLESTGVHEAQVLVSVTVKTAIPAAPTQEPRLWRMRIAVTTAEGTPKVSDVQFVP